jgi:hypothetical protein
MKRHACMILIAGLSLTLGAIAAADDTRPPARPATPLPPATQPLTPRPPPKVAPPQDTSQKVVPPKHDPKATQPLSGSPAPVRATQPTAPERTFVGRKGTPGKVVGDLTVPLGGQGFAGQSGGGSFAGQFNGGFGGGGAFGFGGGGYGIAGGGYGIGGGQFGTLGGALGGGAHGLQGGQQFAGGGQLGVGGGFGGFGGGQLGQSGNLGGQFGFQGQSGFPGAQQQQQLLQNLIRQTVGRPKDWAIQYDPFTGLPVNALDMGAGSLTTDDSNPLGFDSPNRRTVAVPENAPAEASQRFPSNSKAVVGEWKRFTHIKTDVLDKNPTIGEILKFTGNGTYIRFAGVAGGEIPETGRGTWTYNPGNGNVTLRPSEGPKEVVQFQPFDANGMRPASGLPFGRPKPNKN